METPVGIRFHHHHRTGTWWQLDQHMREWHGCPDSSNVPLDERHDREHEAMVGPWARAGGEK